MLRTIDIVEHEVRIYICGIDFTYKDIGENKLPYVTIDGKIKSYENLCKELGVPHLMVKPDYSIGKEEGVYESEFN